MMAPDMQDNIVLHRSTPLMIQHKLVQVSDSRGIDLAMPRASITLVLDNGQQQKAMCSDVPLCV